MSHQYIFFVKTDSALIIFFRFWSVINCTQDDIISCFKKGKKCEAGREILKTQMKNFDGAQRDKNPFITDEDILEAAPESNIIVDDDDIEIEV